MSLAELTATADQIVVGKVVSVHSAWDSSHRRIFSTIEVKIEESWKGLGCSSLTILQPGGSVGDIEMTVHGMPSFQVGEISLLFLEGTERFRVAGMALGQRPLVWDAKSQDWSVRGPDFTDIVEPGQDGRFHPASRAAPELLRAVRARVRALVAR
jgi:hypothetical protein